MTVALHVHAPGLSKSFSSLSSSLAVQGHVQAGFGRLLDLLSCSLVLEWILSTVVGRRPGVPPQSIINYCAWLLFSSYRKGIVSAWTDSFNLGCLLFEIIAAGGTVCVKYLCLLTKYSGCSLSIE